VVDILMSYNPNFTGSVGNGSSRQTQTTFTNGSGGIVAPITAISTNSSGQFVLTDVTDETTVETWIGLTAETIANLAAGLVISDGRLPNVNSLGFSTGDAVWVGATPGQLTNVKPDLTASGWSEGDFVLFVGVIVQNEINPSQQDIQLLRQLIGEL
jgi:hypothetical protein